MTMKKSELILTVIATALVVLTLWSLFHKPDTSGAWLHAPTTTVRFEKDTLSLDSVTYAGRYETTFRYTNTGKHPFIIHGIQTSCGCTSPHWDRKPVPPGQSGDIRIIFEPNSLGSFIKDIEIRCNTPEKAIHLKIRGTVTE